MTDELKPAGRTPIAFISHATADQERFVVDFATRLRAAGVDAWVDRWELRPGDSLVRRIFEGIAEADAFVVVVSANSFDSAWVQEELDAGFIKKLEGTCRVIPVVLDGVTPPAPLRAIVWERIGDVGSYDAEFERIVRAIHGADLDKPAVGPPPSYAAQVRLAGLTATDAVVLRAIGDTVLSREEVPPNPLVDWDVLTAACTTQGLDEHGLEEGVEALGLAYLIEPVHVAERQAPITMSLTTSGWRSYLTIAGFDLPALERELVARLVNDGLTNGQDLTTALRAPWAVVELLLDELAAQGLIQVAKSWGGAAEVFQVSPLLRRRLAK